MDIWEAIELLRLQPESVINHGDGLSMFIKNEKLIINGACDETNGQSFVPLINWHKYLTPVSFIKAMEYFAKGDTILKVLGQTKTLYGTDNSKVLLITKEDITYAKWFKKY